MTTLSHHSRRPFRVFAAVSLLFFLAFSGWTAAVLNVPAISAYDRDLADACAAHASEHPALRLLMVVATHSGGRNASALIALGGALWMWRHHRRRFAFAWLIIAIIYGIMTYGLKEIVGLPRPAEEMRDSEIHVDNKSYPSGHAMGAIVGYGMLGFVLLQRIKNWPRRLAIGAALAAWILLIGISRVYLRAHWGSDVVGGWFIGLAYMNLCLAIYFWRGYPADP